MIPKGAFSVCSYSMVNYYYYSRMIASYYYLILLYYNLFNENRDMLGSKLPKMNGMDLTRRSIDTPAYI